MAERVGTIALQYSLPWPHLDAAGLVMLARWVAGLLLAFGAAHLLAQ